MNRRRFLLQSTLVLAGGLCGLPRLASAMGQRSGAPVPQARLAIIIDDIGFSRQMAHQFLQLDIPLTFSVLPRLALSAELARFAAAKGQEVMLHQPMEPVRADVDPGPGAVFVRDNARRIYHVLEDNMAALPQVSGVNNHMGSLFTQQSGKLNSALEAVRQHGLFFVDSRTSSRSQAFHMARCLNMAALRRNYFLDLNPRPAAVFAQLCRVVRFAHRHGSALAIGHPYPETLSGLTRFIRCNAHSSIDLVHVSTLFGPDAPLARRQMPVIGQG